MYKTFFLSLILALAAGGPLLANKYVVLKIKGFVYEAPPLSPLERFGATQPKKEHIITCFHKPLKKEDRFADPQRLIFTAAGDSLFVKDDAGGTYWLYPSPENRRALEKGAPRKELGCTVEPSPIRGDRFKSNLDDIFLGYEQRFDNLVKAYLELRGEDEPLDRAELDALHQSFHEHIQQQALLELETGNLNLKQLDLVFPERALQLHLPNSPNLPELKLDFSTLEKAAATFNKN